MPLIVFIHGGPKSRDYWAYDPVMQHLAARGYAILQPQFRMSSGFGFKHFKAGWKQWGLIMQDDVTDGIEMLIRQGTVNSNRICSAGASYGGYAAIYGLIKTPQLFRCGISWLGVTDLQDLLYISNNANTQSIHNMIHGDPDKDEYYMKNASIVGNAEKITVPVLLGYGKKDERVPISQGKALFKRLKELKRNVIWTEYQDEGHGWHIERNAIDWGKKIERFLAQHIGDDAQKADANQ